MTALSVPCIGEGCARYSACSAPARSPLGLVTAYSISLAQQPVERLGVKGVGCRRGIFGPGSRVQGLVWGLGSRI
eukprot:1018461-Rhodomonas_salina.1